MSQWIQWRCRWRGNALPKGFRRRNGTGAGTADSGNKRRTVVMAVGKRGSRRTSRRGQERRQPRQLRQRVDMEMAVEKHGGVGAVDENENRIVHTSPACHQCRRPLVAGWWLFFCKNIFQSWHAQWVTPMSLRGYHVWSYDPQSDEKELCGVQWCSNPSMTNLVGLQSTNLSDIV